MLRFWCSVAFTLVLASPVVAAPPNIVLVMTDDQGYGDFGFTGNPVVRTPNLDAMAARSTRLSRFYVSPVCAPTRASLMTGRDAQRTGAIDTYIGRARMHPDETTIAEMLRDAGYATGIFGKWHLGDTFPMRPIDQGFETALVHRGGGLCQPSDPIENERRYTNAIMFRDGEPVETEGYCTDVQFDAGLDFIERSATAGRPFFAYIATNAPHGPWHDVPGDRHVDYAAMDLGPVLDGYVRDPASQVDRTSRIFSMIENIDDNMGRLFETLDRLDLTEDTIVVYLCDNGPEGRRYAGPFQGAKSEIREGGIRSTCLWHRPGTFEPAETAVLSAHLDVAPTLLDLAGVASPDDVDFDGRSLGPWLRNPRLATEDERRLVIQAHRGEAPIRGHQVAVFEGPWKLSHQTGFGRESMPADVEWQLHDVVADPGERVDRADAHPEVVARLRAAYDAWFDDLATTRPEAFDRHPIVIGTPHERDTVLSKQDWTRTAGNGWGTQGVWPVEVAAPMVADLEVVRPQSEAAASASVRFGDEVVAGRFASGERRAWIRGVALDAGRHDVVAWVGDDDEATAPYQVIVHATTPDDDPLPDPDGVAADLSKPVQVYILLGQSNMLGFGKVEGDAEGTLRHATGTKGLYPYLVDDDGAWTTRNDVRLVHVQGSGTGGARTLHDEFLTVKGGKIGPEVGIGHHLGHEIDAPVLLLKSCIGNRSLGWDLLPPGSPQYEFDGMTYAGYRESPLSWETGTEPEPIDWYAGMQYDGDIARAKAVLASLEQHYPGAAAYEIAGFFWWQGDKDRYQEAHARKYEENLVRLIETLRTEFDAPDAPFVIATLGQTETGADGNEGLILDAMLAVDGESGRHPEFRDTVATVYTHPLSKGGASNSHYNGHAETYMNVGEAMGRAMVELRRRAK